MRLENILVFVRIGSVISQIMLTDSLRKKMFLEVIKARPNTTFAVSTLALRFPLCRLASVAGGPAKVELMSALGINNAYSTKSCFTEMRDILQEAKELLLFNKIFVQDTDVDVEFFSNVTSYNVQTERIGFEYPNTALSFINRLVSQVSLRRIENILEATDIDKNTTMLIATGAHYKATWESPFDIKKTKSGRFRHIDQRVSHVPMMHRQGHFQFFNDHQNDFQMLTIVMHSYGTTMSFVVPGNTLSLASLISKVAQYPSMLTEARSKSSMQFVRVNIPRFKVKSCIDLNRHLKEIGIKKIFDPSSSGLEGILKKNNVAKRKMFLGVAKQKVFIEIDEFGVNRPNLNEAIDDHHGAYKIRDNYGMEFIADRPFLFTVNVHNPQAVRGRKATSHPSDITDELFSGVYYGP